MIPRDLRHNVGVGANPENVLDLDLHRANRLAHQYAQAGLVLRTYEAEYRNSRNTHEAKKAVKRIRDASKRKNELLDEYERACLPMTADHG